MSGHAVPRLTLGAKELAEALGVSLRFIREHQSEIPHVWIGNRVLFPVDEVREWLRDRTQAATGASQKLVDEILNEMEAS